MKSALLTLAAGMLLWQTAVAQSYTVGAYSPLVTSNGMVTFRVRMGKANAVEVGGQFAKERLKLTQASNVWSATTGPVAPGIYEYSVYVDGNAMVDPGNPALKPQRNPQASILHVPANPPAAWDWQNVPHGTVHQHGYLSKTLNQPREVWVYTPPGYEKSGKKYPLLVLQHGSGDNEQTWVAHGKANWILDNLVAAGKAKPMIVMMIDGHPYGMGGRDLPPEKRSGTLGAFQHELFDDAMPLVESLYRVEKAPANRAIAGLSMGGNQSLVTGLNRLDKFAWVAGMSSAIRDTNQISGFLAAPATANAKLRLLWIGVGNNDFLLKENQRLDAILTEKGIKHIYRQTEGDHSWPVWRGYLAELAPLLFQK
jgi:enterochelin esterase family protein